MSTLSLDLRGRAATQALPSGHGTRGAGVSLLIHSVGISALLLVPLLRSSDPPRAAGALRDILIEPIRVALPTAPVLDSATKRVAPQPKQSFTAPIDPAPLDLRLALNTGDVLDPALSQAGSDNGDVGSSQGGDCVLGTLCGTVQIPVADPTPVEIPRIGPTIKEPRLLESRSPQYPPVAQSAGVSGRVIVEVQYGRDGRFREARVLQSHPLFDEAALASVRSRRYEPLLLNGVPTDFLITITVIFNVKR